MIEVLLQHRLREVYYLAPLDVPDESLVQLEVAQALHSLVAHAEVDQAQSDARGKRVALPLDGLVTQGLSPDLGEKHLGHQAVARAFVEKPRADDGRGLDTKADFQGEGRGEQVRDVYAKGARVMVVHSAQFGGCTP